MAVSKIAGRRALFLTASILSIRSRLHWTHADAPSLRQSYSLRLY